MISVRIKKNFEELQIECSHRPNAVYFSKILASWLHGESSLPQRIGLSRHDFQKLMEDYFHLAQWIEKAPSGISAVDAMTPEKEELIELFLEHRAGVHETEVQIATIMASGCLAKDHLWHDLGLWCRPDLSAMIRDNFPPLFEKNIKNMKWKKFFYKQMCLDLDSAYVCKVPSCAECIDYRECYPSTELNDEFDKATIQAFDQMS